MIIEDEQTLLNGVQNGTGYSATSTATSDGPISVTESQDSYGERAVAVTVIPNGSSFKSDETMKILVGAFNNSGFEQPISDATINITVQRPDETTWESSATTGSQGNAQVDYDLSNDDQNGTYEIIVTDISSGASATVNPDVGPAVIPAERDYKKAVTGEDHNLGFLVRNGQYGIAGEQLNITVEAPNNTVVDTQMVETDSAGFANITATPTETGFYNVEAEVVSTDSTTEHGFEAGSAVLNSDYAFGEAITREPFVYGGYLEGSDGLLRNEPVQVVISNENAEIINISTTTDNSGFLLIESQIDDPGYYDVDVTTESGLTATGENIDVTDPYEGDSGESDLGVELDITSQSSEVSPGSNATFNIEATDNGSPIANEQIQIFARLDYNGVPLHSETVTTDENGLAVIEVPTPSDIDGADIDGEARLTYNGSTYDESFYSNIQQYDFDYDFDYSADVGSTATFGVSVEPTDGTGSVANLPVQYNALRGENVLDSYASGELVTDQSGQAEESVAIPHDLRPDRAVVPFSRVDNKEDASSYYVRMFDFPGTAEISGISEETDYGRPVVQPGDQITVNFTTDSGNAASGFTFISIEHNSSQDYAEAAIADDISTNSNATLTIPEYAKSDGFNEVRVWTADSQGRFYVAEIGLEIDSESSDDEPEDGDSTDDTDSASGLSAPAITEPSDFTYDPSSAVKLGTYHNASGIISTNDVAVRFVNVTNGNSAEIALNDSSTVPIEGYVNTTIPAGELSDDVTIEAQLYNTSAKSAVATTTINLTAASGTFVDVDASDLPGDGSQSAPYEISNASELQAMEDELDADYELVNDIDASKTALWNNKNGFAPIGGITALDGSPAFTGSLNGNGYTITELTIGRLDDTRVGLFGRTEGTVSNLSLAGVTITGDRYVGGIAGEHAGIITNVTVSGNLTGDQDVGMVAGSNAGTITLATASGTVDGAGVIGGLVGSNQGEITTATASSNVNGDTFGSIGGLVGRNSDRGNITNVTASGTVTGIGAGSNDVGGLVGDNTGIITNAAAFGKVNASDNVGGLVGRNDGGGNALGGTIRETFAVGLVSGESSVGGLVGSNTAFDGSTGRVINSYFDSETTEKSGSISNVTSLTTAEMIGGAARTNMTGLEFGTVWRTQAGDYPTLTALSADSSDSTSQLAAQIDTDNDGRIGDFEILQAIEYWRGNQVVPGTNRTISDQEVLTLVDMWQTETEVKA